MYYQVLRTSIYESKRMNIPSLRQKNNSPFFTRLIFAPVETGPEKFLTDDVTLQTFVWCL